jgi:acyl-CoA synthetase (AMP-forming)/AMP-acid ligase II/carbon monoxide dehydrogenase subunit G
VRIDESIILRARPSAVWKLVGDPAGYAQIMSGVTRWERKGRRGEVEVGARYAMRMQVGSTEVGGLVEIVECQPGCDIAWTGVTGIEQRGRWRLREYEPGMTTVTLRIAYQAPGGVWGLIADSVSARQVRTNVRRTLETLRTMCEGESADSGGVGGQDAVGLAAQSLQALRVLASTGILRPTRPDRLLNAGLAVHRWGMSIPGGYGAAAARFPDDVAVIDERGAATFAQVDRDSNALANGLADAGIREGDRVGVLCRNHRGFVETTLALSKLGADVLYLNTGFAAPQLAEVLRREQAVAVVHDEEFGTVVGDALPRNRRFLAWSDDAQDGGDVERLIAEFAADEPQPPERHSRITILTSGTTGAPKGASRGQPRSADPLLAILSRIPLRAREKTLVAAPLFHAWGAAHFGLGVMLSSTLVLQRRFDPERTLAAIHQHRITALAAVPVMLQRMLDLPEEVRRRCDTSSLRVVAVSGSSLSGELASRFMDAFGDVVYNLYGSTEVAWATIATPDDLRAAPGTTGRPPFGTVVRLLDDKGQPVADGGSGRIFVGNRMLFEGYTGGGGKDVVDGLMATGDVGRFDEEGRLFVEGRDDEMIVSGGENVFPAEVEEALVAHPHVADAAVVGVADEEWGQRLRAFVVPRNGVKLSVDDVKSHVRSRLARHKVPRDVEFVRELPRNSTGKVVKRDLHSAQAPARAAKRTATTTKRTTATRTSAKRATPTARRRPPKAS